MLKIQDLSEHQDITQVYQSRRNKEVVEIRRIQREQTFKKKRLYLEPAQPSSQSTGAQQANNKEEESTQSTKFAVVDQRFRQQILVLNKCVYKLQQLQYLMSLLRDDDPMSVMCGVIGLRKILSGSSAPPIQEVMDAGAVDRLLELVDWKDWPQVQLESLWCITNILSGTTDQCASVISKGALPLLVQLLQDNTLGVVEQAVWALGNVSSDCTRYRDMAIEAGAVDGIVSVIYTRGPSAALIKESCWALSNLCRGAPLPDYNKVKFAMRVFCAMLATGCITEMETYADCCWAISYHCDGLKQRLDAVMDSNLLQRLVPLATATDNLMLLLPCLRVLGQVSTGPAECVAAVLDNGGLDLLQKCIGSSKKMLRREGCWILSNITASSFEHIAEVLKREGMVRRLVNMFLTDSEQVCREISYIFSNLAHSARRVAIDQLLIELGVIEGFIALLSSDDDKSVLSALEGLGLILRVAETKKKERGVDVNIVVHRLHTLQGTSILEGLQYNENQSIYFKVNYILTQYFELYDPTEGRLEIKRKDSEEKLSGSDDNEAQKLE